MEQTCKITNIIIPTKLRKKTSNDNLSFKTSPIEIKKASITKWEFKEKWIISNIET